MKKLDYLLLAWFAGLLVLNFLVTLSKPATELEGIQYYPDFVRGVTSIVGITIAVIVFLLTSILKEYPKGITKERIIIYLLAILGSLTLVILSYMAMIRGEIHNSVIEMITAFGIVFVTFINLLGVYVALARK